MEIKIPKQDAARSEGSLKVSVGTRLREIRQEKGLSQADLQERTGVHRCYISRIEHGPTVPSLQTLEKFAAALDVPLYRIFYEGKERPAPTHQASTPNRTEAEHEDVDARFLRDLKDLWSQMGEREREVLLGVAKRLANRGSPSPGELEQDRLLDQARSGFSQGKNGQAPPAEKATSGRTTE